MKKKVISLFLTVGMIMGLTACGGSANEFIVEIEGDKYDLSGDFQEVKGFMVANDMSAADLAEQLQDGDIDEYSIMTYDYDNEQMVFYYDTYFMDEEWSSDKFR